MSAPKIALVICTRNRASKLDSFFEALKGIDCNQPWEMVIVNNGSTDDTAARLELFAATYPKPVKIVNEPQAGLGRARNAGWRATEAEIIAFTDDDCYPTASYLQDVLAVYADKLVGFSGGKILLFDRTDARITIYEHPDEQLYPASEFIAGGVIQGANMAFRRQALVDISGFDDQLGAGTPFAFEDVDAELRALAAGWTGKYDPRPTIYHHHGRKPGPEVQKLMRVYDSGRGAYYLKCILFMPQRWRCFGYWQRGIRRQPLGQTFRELKAALSYLIYQFTHKPNTAY